jgi:hypothetical protein
MTDRLDRAFRALRESEEGHDPRAEETLARILRHVERSPARRGRRAMRVWLLAAAVVAVTTAAAARSGQLGRVLRLVAWRDDAPSAGTPSLLPAPPPGSSPLDPPTAGQPTLAMPESAAIENAPGVVPSPAPPGNLPSRPLTAAPGRRESIATGATTPHAASASASANAAAASPNTAPSASAVASADDQAFARAHALHFHGGDPAAALAAWDEYLRAYPSGRFAPEARYNRAIDLLKLGRNGEAREALQPFADGAFGGYRRDEAQGILRSLDGAARSPR